MTTTAGSTALDMFRTCRARRRRRVAAAIFSMAVAGAAGLVGLGAPVILILAGAGVGLLAIALWGPGARDIDRWRRGASGERLTSQMLGDLPRRWTVWHDLRVPGSRANIDHVVVGRTGVWVIDTKSTRATVRAGWRSVRFGDRRLDTGPTRWEARVLSTALGGELGHDDGDGTAAPPFPVRAIVAVHGTGLRPRGARVGGVRVVPADRLLPVISRGRRRLTRSEVRRVGDALEGLCGPNGPWWQR